MSCCRGKTKAQEKEGVVLAKRTRPTKPDFAPFYRKHREILESKQCGVDYDKVIKLRHWIHENCEGGFKEFETQKKITETLIGFGVNPDHIKKCAGTGLVVDIRGKGPEAKADKGQGTVSSVAIRADMDGLPIVENNPHLEYCSQNGWAHMCGHDGHMATILTTAQVLMNNLDKIPKNQFVRLLFQPAEEYPGGAKHMVAEGCMKDIDEVYGFHNIPNFDEGDIRVCEGGFFAQSTVVNIEIKGKGGHCSVPQKLNDPMAAAAMVLTALNTIQARDIDSRENVCITMCQIHCGSTYNVVHDSAFVEGRIGSYSPEVLELVKQRIIEVSEGVASALKCKAIVKLTPLYPAVVNAKDQTRSVIRLAKKYFGEDNFSQDEVPLQTAEDFSYFLHEKPGCFFALGTMKEGLPLQTLHTSKYDYNDDLVATGAYFFLRILEDRLNLQILPQENCEQKVEEIHSQQSLKRQKTQADSDDLGLEDQPTCVTSKQNSKVKNTTEPIMESPPLPKQSSLKSK